MLAAPARARVGTTCWLLPQAPPHAPGPSKALVADNRDFFNECSEANRFLIREVIGKGSYGIVCSAVDQFTGERVAIKKITNVFEHVSDATRILREIKLLRMLKHPGGGRGGGGAGRTMAGRRHVAPRPQLL